MNKFFKTDDGVGCFAVVLVGVLATGALVEGLRYFFG